ncbi:acyl-CoA thioesterase [Kibdelosporangium philippinense]|uniref:Acyl-CoA thioesterase n=1 Tax=Kibdelosporangium philippinense TaxID=211113 RepID=A0ABS8ZA17_9PSEU|nr:thioesterase family protein [Kibdelosporangium philippinense]MCE7004703.1 acyl-CoA thioesterase [Kibdelosporangium philippinense]
MTAAPSTRVGARLQAVRRRVEHADTDASGVVHFARYAVLQETALLENLERLGVGLGVLASGGLDLVVVEATTRYRFPARYPEELSLEPVVGHLGAARARIDTTIRRLADSVELATGSLVVALTDRVTGAPCALLPALHAVLEEARSDVPR